MQVLVNPRDAQGLQITRVNTYWETKVRSVPGRFVSSVTKLPRNVLTAGEMRNFFKNGSVVTLTGEKKNN